MTAPVPEETNAAFDVTEKPPGEHDSELTGAGDDEDSQAAGDQQQAAENAGTSLDQPSS